MKYSMITAALLTLLVSINVSALSPQRRLQLKLRQIQTTLRNTTDICDRNQDVCSNILVREVITEHHQKDLNETDTFCKAATAIQSVKTDVRPLHEALEQLATSLIINGLEKLHKKSGKCLVNEDETIDVAIDLRKFLKTLLHFTQNLYKQADASIGLGPTTEPSMGKKAAHTRLAYEKKYHTY